MATYMYRPNMPLTECDNGTIQKSHLGNFTVEKVYYTTVCVSTTQLARSSHCQYFSLPNVYLQATV
jgi:cell division protein FtsL